MVVLVVVLLVLAVVILEAFGRHKYQKGKGEHKRGVKLEEEKDKECLGGTNIGIEKENIEHG